MTTKRRKEVGGGISVSDTHRLLLPASLEDDRVTAEEVELVHLGLAERHDRVVVGDRVIDHQAVPAVWRNQRAM